MTQRNNEAKLKTLVKAAVLEVFEERQDLVREALAEAIEDLGLIEAIKEGSPSELVGRDEVFRMLGAVGDNGVSK